jgi:hypothetical protein
MAGTFKTAQWPDRAAANMELFHWLSEQYPGSFVVSLFHSVISGAEAPDIQLVAYMMHSAQSVVLFKFPFTLVSILWKEENPDRAALKPLVYWGLKRVAEEQVFDSKTVAMFKLLLKSAVKKGLLSKIESLELDNIAESAKIFSDERFLALKQDVESLKQQVSRLENRVGAVESRASVAERNLQILADSVNGLKKAFRRQAQRRLVFSVAATGLSFVCAQGLVEAVAAVADLSDLAEVGSVVMDIPQDQAQSYLDGGMATLALNSGKIVSPAAEMAIKRLGLNPDKFLETWMEANVLLHGSEAQRQALVTPSSSSSSSATAAETVPSPTRVQASSSAGSSASPARPLPSRLAQNAPAAALSSKQQATAGQVSSPALAGMFSASPSASVAATTPAKLATSAGAAKPSPVPAAYDDYDAPPPDFDEEDEDALEARVIGNYKARSDKELTVVKGAIVSVLEQKPSGWWVCELNGKQGLVPGNRLSLIETAPTFSP